MKDRDQPFRGDCGPLAWAHRGVLGILMLLCTPWETVQELRIKGTMEVYPCRQGPLSIQVTDNDNEQLGKNVPWTHGYTARTKTTEIPESSLHPLE